MPVRADPLNGFIKRATFQPVIDRKPTVSWQKKLDRDSRVRQLMRKRVTPDLLGNVYTLGYTMATAYKFNREVYQFLGSSLNRKKQDAKQQSFDFGAGQDPRRDSSEPGMRVGDKIELPELLPKRNLPVQGGGIGALRMLAPRSRGKIRDKFNALFAASGKNCTFATLTFIQYIRDGSAIKALNKFLTSLRKKFTNLQYIWVAERQNKNETFKGNIHFHVMLNKYLPIAEFNALWILQQYNAGLKGFSKKKGRVLELWEVMSMYMRDPKELQKYLNPLDIKKVYSPDRLAAYLTTYITKNKDSFGCAAWHCSRGVSRTFTKTVIPLELFNQITDPEINYCHGVDRQTGEVTRYTGETFILKHVPFVLIGYVLNKKYFGQKMNVVDAINRWILDENFVPDLPLLTEQYLTRITNQQLN